MRQVLFHRLAPCACLLLAGVSAPVWADPGAPFNNFQGWRDEPVQDWRAVNDRVGEVGGWRTYLRESHPEGGAGHEHGAATTHPQPDGDARRGGHAHHHHGH